MNDQSPSDMTADECRRILEGCMECPATERLIAFYEDELAPGDAETVAAHTGNCPECARLLEQLTEADSPMVEDAEYRSAREEDRAEVAKALGFRVARPPSRPLLERLSWLWETRVPALVPAGLTAMLLLILVWPAPHESAVTGFGPLVRINSSDRVLRDATDGAQDYRATVNDLLLVHHDFQNTRLAAGTMVNREIIGPDGVTNLGAVSVETVTENQREKLFVEFPLSIDKPGIYQLRLSHPGNLFPPVSLKIEIIFD